MSKVVIKKCNDYILEDVKNHIFNSLELLGGLDNLINKDANVFVKFNCVGPFSKDQGITTHPVIIEAVLQLIKTRTNNIIVGDNPATRDIIYTLKKNGIYDVLIRENVKILNGKDVKKIYNPSAKIYNEFEVSKEMAEADVLINLPKLKTHSLAYMTCAEKNFFGFIYGLNKAGWHVKASNPLEFGEAINDLYGAILESYKGKTIINICDGILGLEGEGPSSGGIKKNANAIITSLDAVSLDRIACELVSLDYKKCFITNIANNRGYGVSDLENIEILGNKLYEFNNIKFLAPKDSLSNIGLKFLKIKPLRNILLEHPKINTNLCIKCGECAKICPPHTMKLVKGKFPKLSQTKCIRCWCCAEVCPQNAIEKTKRPILGRIFFK